jgi:type VI protein secretion system component Hcp
MGKTERFNILLDGVNGPETDKSIPCLDFGFGTRYTNRMINDYLAESGMKFSGLEDITPFTFIHRFDSATPTIQKYCGEGRLLKSAVFRYSADAEGGGIFTVLMEQVQITSAIVKTVPAEGAAVRVVEEVNLMYKKIGWGGEAPEEPFLSLTPGENG